MFDSIAMDVSAFVAAVYALSPVAIRMTFDFAARCNPTQISLDELPDEVAAVFRNRIPQIQALGFEPIGCFDCGRLASETHSYTAYFCNHRTNDFANVSALVWPNKMASYIEFSTRFTNGTVLETNTNGVLPLTPPNPSTRVFRFPAIQDVRLLFETHRRLVEKYAGHLWVQAEPRGQEIQRLVRVVENYGPRHAVMGYMVPSEDGASYKLTWKGACLITWRGLWPVCALRKWMHRNAMQSEWRSLQSEGLAALQKA
jgi:hypothetical protein